MIDYNNLPFKITNHTKYYQLQTDKSFINFHNDLKNKIINDYKECKNYRYKCICGRYISKTSRIKRHLDNEIHIDRFVKMLKREKYYLNKLPQKNI